MLLKRRILLSFFFACGVLFVYQQVLPKPVFSLQPGYYPDSIFVAINSPVTGAMIYYTTDGSVPTQNSFPYTNPIIITNTNSIPDNYSTIPTNPSFAYPLPGYDMQRANSRGWLPPYSTSEKVTVLKARIFKPGFVSLPDSCAVATYFIRSALQNAYSMPVVSITADSLDFFSHETGIYVYGNDSANDGNYGKTESRKIHIEFFETNGNLVISQFCDAKIHGHGGRHAPQKSLQLIAREEYGNKFFDHKFFPNENTKQFSRLLLRNGGHRPDCMPRDDIAGDVLQTLDNVVQHSRQCVVFLNGEYWGVQSIKEILDDNYLSNKYNWKNSYSTILAQTGTLDEGYPGAEQSYTELLDFVQNADLTQSENYNHVWEVIDKNTFIDFQCAHIFLGNGDWPDNNAKFWHFNYGPNYPGANNVADGRWRWMIYDLDAAFGGDCSAPSVNFNVLDDALNPAHGSYTQILRNLILNDSFKVFFINRFADLLNSNFLSSKLNSSVQNVKNVYDPEMMRYVNRWRYPSDSTTLAGRLFEVPSLNKWNSISNYLTSFALNRPAKTRNQFNNYFTLNDTVKITINVNDTVMGKIKLNSLYLDKDLNRDSAKIYPWSGIYFKGNPITVTAIPYPGYKFKNWGQATDTNAQKTVLITSGSTITAYFEQDTAFDPLQFLFINEILPHNNYSIFDEFVEHDGWIEIYNPNSFAVDLKDFFITDDLNNKTKFRINERSQTSIIPAKKHFILWADKDTLQGKLHLNFQLNSGGGELYLIAPNGFSLVDSVIYTSVKADVSVGRSSDGNNEWKEFVIPTPNETNRTIDNPEPEKLFIWPNPAQNNETITLSRKTDITIYDVCGKIIRQEMNVKYIDLAGFPKGLYFIHPAAGATQKLIVY